MNANKDSTRDDVKCKSCKNRGAAMDGADAIGHPCLGCYAPERLRFKAADVRGAHDI